MPQGLSPAGPNLSPPKALAGASAKEVVKEEGERSLMEEKDMLESVVLRVEGMT